MCSDRPPTEVLRAFGAEGSARRLTGGQGTAWIAGDLVLKPDGGPVHEWLGLALADLQLHGVRLSLPVPTRNGAWVCEGWSATRWVEGDEPDYAATSTWIDIVEAGRAFHRAVAHLAHPDCLDSRTDRWAMADRAVWGESPIHFRPEFTSLARQLEGALEPLGDPQLEHADLTHNVLFTPGLAPAVIDISPYWRPPEYAEGIVLADALCWHGASASLLQSTGVSVAAVARALLFRMTTTHEVAASEAGRVDVQDELGRYWLAAQAIGV